MVFPKASELHELLRQAIVEPNLTINNMAQILYQYRDGLLPAKLSTADMNKVLSKIGVQGKGNRGIRGELCICFVHMKMWNRQDVQLAVDELCKRYDLHHADVENDPYFCRYCYYLQAVLDIVKLPKLMNFIILDVLIPLSGSKGIKYITGGDKEAPRTMIRYKAFELESRLLRTKTVCDMISSRSPLLCRIDDSFAVSLLNSKLAIFSEYVTNKHQEITSKKPLLSCATEVGYKYKVDNSELAVEEGLLSKVPHALVFDTSNDQEQVSNMACLQILEESVLSKRSYGKTSTSPVADLYKHIRLSSNSNDHHLNNSSTFDGYTTGATDSSSIFEFSDEEDISKEYDLRNIPDKMKNVPEFKGDVSFVPPLYSLLSPQYDYIYSQPFHTIAKTTREKNISSMKRTTALYTEEEFQDVLNILAAEE